MKTIHAIARPSSRKISISKVTPSIFPSASSTIIASDATVLFDTQWKEEVGKVFAKVLEHAGVYKRDQKGKEAFLKFVSSI